MPSDEARLEKLLGEIFADNIVTAEERQDLIELQAELRPDRVRQVLVRFVATKWGEALSDGVFTAEEKLVLQRVLEELQLPDEALPSALRSALR